MPNRSRSLLPLVAGTAMLVVACEGDPLEPTGSSSATPEAPQFDASSGGATVIKDFGCWLGPAEWGGPFPLYTDDTQSVITPSGNTMLSCKFEIPDGFEPPKAVRNSGFLCNTFMGPTNDSEAVATPGGNASLSCTIHPLRVNTTDDEDDGLCDDTHCSLREAIHASNSMPGLNYIHFRIPGPGPHTIQPGSPLPEVTDAATIDGTSEPDFEGTPIVELDGSNAGGEAEGLILAAGNTTVRGLVINRFSFNGIVIPPGSSGNVVEGNYLGTDVTGTVPLGNGFSGVAMVFAPDNTVGGATEATRNLLSGNLAHGVAIIGPDAHHNSVLGNYIGTDVTGTVPLGNAQHGVFIFLAPQNTVGGGTAAARNVISANGVHGVHITLPPAHGNSVLGNYIGTDVTGTVPLGNGIHGVSIANAPGNMVGDSEPNHGNLISGNVHHGIEIIAPGAQGTSVQGNFIGTDVTGTAALGNGELGVLILDAPSNTVGGDESGARNVISGNGVHGVHILAPGAHGNSVLGNFIGTDVTGTAAVGNGLHGVSIVDAAGNMVGGATAAARNVISGNALFGVEMIAPGAHDNSVQGNFIGTDVTGTAALGNGEHGVFIVEGSANLVGGTEPGTGNLISGNGVHGVHIVAPPTTGNSVKGNMIGTDVTGTAPVGNGLHGVSIADAHGNVVGGPEPGAGNLISGNVHHGLEIIGPPAHDNAVQGNLIGTDATGTVALGNGEHGIIIQGNANLVGGEAPGEGNLISGNGAGGIVIEGGAVANSIFGNLIGTDITGAAALGNGGRGVDIFNASDNAVGTWGPGGRNVISANQGGVRIAGDAHGNAVRGNYIGTDVSGTLDLGNAAGGVLIAQGAFDNTIGDLPPGSGNRIAFSARAGIRLVGGAGPGNAIRGNSIFSNGGLGIDNGDAGPTGNDFQDPDMGANDLQNFPILLSATGPDGPILGEVNSTPGTEFRIELFASSVCDPEGYGEGEIFLGHVMVTTDGPGDAGFDVSFPGNVPAGMFITATATAPNGSTSEFSPCVLAF